jgi:hypothetical protein
MDTKTINLRDVPDDLVRRAKAYAALRGQSLKGFIIDSMRQALEEGEVGMPPMTLFTQIHGTPKAKSKSRKHRK